MMLRQSILLGVLTLLAACASPCSRIEAETRQLTADAVRRPAIVLDGRYVQRLQELTAQRIEHRCGI